MVPVHILHFANAILAASNIKTETNHIITYTYRVGTSFELFPRREATTGKTPLMF
jgi:hypothetical protein